MGEPISVEAQVEETRACWRQARALGKEFGCRVTCVLQPMGGSVRWPRRVDPAKATKMLPLAQDADLDLSGMTPEVVDDCHYSARFNAELGQRMLREVGPDPLTKSGGDRRRP